MTRLQLIASVAVLTLAASCSAGQYATFERSAVSTVSDPDAQAVAERSIVRTSDLTVETESIDTARAQVTAIVAAHQGMIEREATYERSTSVRIRVPEPQFEATIASLGEIGEVLHQSSNSVDVTVEAADMDARIQNLVASRDRLRALAARAGSVEDVIAVERELARVQGEIDVLESRRRVLRDEAAMSTVDLRLQQRTVPGPITFILNGAFSLVSKLFVWR